MSNTPRFPLHGITLSHNVSLDRISLCVNTIASDAFPVGQYVFFEKDNSIWYRYTNDSTPWTNDILYISGGYEQNTKFDTSGYPVTAWKDADGNMHIQLYIEGVKEIFPLLEGGSLPTVVIDGDVYVFWVPLDYATQLSTIHWSQLCDGFRSVKSFNAQFLGDIAMMNIQVVASGYWMFVFEIEGTPKNKTYVSFT